MDYGQVYNQVFSGVFAGCGLIIMIIMPIIFRNIKYESEAMGFGLAGSAIFFTLTLSACAAHFYLIHITHSSATLSTFALVVAAVIGIIFFYSSFLRYIFK